MKRKLFLHIGTEKTGTTSIQAVMFKNYDTLKTNGILYPKTFAMPNHVGMCVAFQKSKSELNAVVNAGMQDDEIKEYRRDLLAKLEKEIEESNCHTVIISNEHLHSRIHFKEEIEDIYSWLAPIFDEVIVVCYLRRQVELAISHFSTAIKNGETSLDLFPSFTSIPHYYDYKSMLNMWYEFFPHIICREFDRKKLKNGDVVEDFLALVDFDNSEGKLLKVDEQNKSLDGKVIEFLAQINQNIPFIKNGNINPERRNLVRFFEDVPVKNKLVPNNDDAVRFQNKFNEDNQYIAQKFCQIDDIFVLNKQYKQVYEFGLSSDDYTYIFSEFWKKVSHNTRFLEARNAYFQAEIAYLKGEYEKALSFIDNSLASGIRLPKAINLKEKILIKIK